MEQNHVDVAAMLADYRDNGPSALLAYEKKRARPSKDDKVRSIFFANTRFDDSYTTFSSSLRRVPGLPDKRLRSYPLP